MSTTSTGPLGTLTVISLEEVDPESTGTPTHLRIKYSLDTTDATEPLVGFRIWHDDAAGVTVPVWVDACNAALAGGGDGGDPLVYEVLVPVPLATTGATWWETFEEYAVGSITESMNYGGASWDGPAIVRENYFRIVSSEDFESYSVGVAPLMNGGQGWDGPAVVKANL